MRQKKKKVLEVVPSKTKNLVNPQKNQRFLRKQVRAMFCVSTKYITKKNVIIFSDNISMGGVFLETFEPLPVGTKVTLRFPFKSVLRPIQVQGKVVWNRKDFAEGKLGNKLPGMAIAFEKLERKNLNFIKEFLDQTPSYGWFLE